MKQHWRKLLEEYLYPNKDPDIDDNWQPREVIAEKCNQVRMEIYKTIAKHSKHEITVTTAGSCTWNIPEEKQKKNKHLEDNDEWGYPGYNYISIEILNRYPRIIMHSYVIEIELDWTDKRIVKEVDKTIDKIKRRKKQ